MRGFTHLNAVSGFSLRYGASHPEWLAERAAERGLDALALTDRDTVAGAVRFARACARTGVRPLFGAALAVPETYLVPPRPGMTTRRRTPARGGAFVEEPVNRAVFLARDRRGWGALCRLVSAAHTPDGLTWGDLGAGGGSVYAVLGPDTEVGRALAAGRPDRAAALLRPWRDTCGDALRLETVWHGRTGTGPGSLRLAARTVAFAAEQQVAAVLSNTVRYADPGLGEVADVLDAARRLVPIDVTKPEALDNGECWLKDPAEMIRIAERIAQAAGTGRQGAHRLLRVTEETAADCAVDPEADLGLGQVHFPEAALVGAGTRTADRVLRSRCAAAMLRLGHERDPVRWARLDAELDVIARLGYASYFLTVGQVVDDVRRMGVRVAARGSGAGSFVNHLLGIASADPVEHGLMMERFLSVRRRALPDIDIDVESARRLDVYRAIIDRFGAERVATVAMPETYRVRHAIRDVGAALGMEPSDIDRLAKAFPHIRARDARAALAELPELRAEAGEEHGRLWDLVEALDGLPRGVAMHPCGVLLSDAGLLDRTPVVPTSGEGFPMSQFDKDDVEDLGLLKLDVLGVRMQSAMAHALTEIERTGGGKIDLEAIPPGDPATYELIRSAETLGCFQIESPGQRDLVGRLQPRTFHDLVVDISLFRPGPVAADMVKPFIEARHGRRPARYPHRDLRDALRETYGVVVFHEQVIEIMHVLTGCDRAMADEARRALSDPDRQGRVRAWFGRLARERGYQADVIRRTWEILEAFGAYGFCKAHAVAFAVPTYESAWLKAHHPAAFYAGVLTHDPGMYPKRLLLADARRRGVPVLPLDVNRSGAVYRIELVSGAWGLRLALCEVHGISEAETARIAAQQPYSSLQDLWERARPGRAIAERLVQVGALDTFNANRRELLLQVAELHRQGRSAGADGQLTLAEGESAPPAGLPDMDERERLGAELDVLGMDTSRHLMGDHYAFLDELGAVPADRLRDVRHGANVLVAGAKAATQTPPIRSGRRVIFTTLDDGTGLTDCAFFDDSHESCAHTVFHSWLLLVRGAVQRRGPQSLSVVGAAAWNLAELIELRRTEGLDAVRERLAERIGAEVADAATDRRIHLPTGYEMHPWADLRPAGGTPRPEGLRGSDDAATGRKLWHSSPGSAGR
jgi:error-prone DNA polymerase